MITGNEPAMPRDHRYDGHNGLTIRQLFAGQIMAALNENNYSKIPQEILATKAVKGADALIEELNKPYK